MFKFMKLFLSGGGSEAFDLDKQFLKEIDKTKPILYIPIAMDPKRHPYSECLEWIKRYLGAFGFDNIEMATDLKSISKKDLEKFGGIYIGGGDTSILLKAIKESGFYEHLKYLVANDLPIAGGSAGAIIFAKTILPAIEAEGNPAKLEDLTGFNVLKDFELDAHYEPEMDSGIKAYMDKHKMEKVVALPEKCGLYVTDKEMKVMGEHSAWVFDEHGKKEIGIGENIK